MIYSIFHIPGISRHIYYKENVLVCIRQNLSFAFLNF